MDEPYFTVELGFLQGGGRAAQISPARDGVSLGQALQPGGVLQDALTSGDREKKFVLFLVDPGSIETYYAAVKEIRTMKFQYNWQPWNGKQIVIRLDNTKSGQIEAYP